MGLQSVKILLPTILNRQVWMKGNKDKAKVRSTKAWKEWRLKCYKNADGKDYVTGKKLYKGWNLHHLDESIENYAVFTDDRFIPLNKKTHDMIEWLWMYYRKDPEVIERLKSVMERMLEFLIEHSNERQELEDS